MRISKKWNQTFFVLAILFCSLTSCSSSKKLDKFVAAQYNNELPKLNKKKNADIEVASLTGANSASISTTVHKTDKFLPLLFYWKYNHRQQCTLNQNIPVTNFSNAVNAVALKGLNEKLNGRKLELTVEQAPAAFSIVLKENMVVLLLYSFRWAKVYIEPDAKDLVVAYKLTNTDQTTKNGKILVKNNDKNKGFRFFQSWKSATSEYITNYNANVTNMSKAFVSQLTEEL